MKQDALDWLTRLYWDTPCDECGCGAYQHVAEPGSAAGTLFARCMTPGVTREQYDRNVRDFKAGEHDQVDDENYFGSNAASKCYHCGYCCKKAQCSVSVEQFGTIPNYESRNNLCPALYQDGNDWLCQLSVNPRIAQELSMDEGCCSTMNSFRQEKIRSLKEDEPVIAKGAVTNERYDISVTFEFGGVERTAEARIYPSGDGQDQLEDIDPGDYEPFLSDEDREEAERIGLSVAHAVLAKAVDTGDVEVAVAPEQGESNGDR